MINYKFYILFLSFNLIFITSYSQESNKNNDLIKKVERVLKEIDSTARRFDYKQRLSNRKIIINGWVEKTNKTFTQMIKHYRSGLKKEVIKLYSNSPNKKTLLMFVVKINDKFEYVEFYDDVKENNLILSKEILIDNRLYQNTIILK